MPESISLEELASLLKTICGDGHVSTDRDELNSYGRDQTGGLQFPFDVLVRPGSADEIAAILKICNQYKIPVTPRGGGSGVTGGALPVNRGIVLSLERLNRIVTVNKEDLYAVAESGVITAELGNAVADAGLYLPVQPSSSSFSFVGGNVAENAGSIHSCKYGVTGSYILNLEVVLPGGEIIWTGANVVKNVAGLNLTSLFVGSEGTLGIITKVVYRLLTQPVAGNCLLMPFQELEQACETVSAIRFSGWQPSAAELICKNASDLVARHTGHKWIKSEEKVEAFLLVEIEENNEVVARDAMEAMAAIAEEHGAMDVLVADTKLEKMKLRSIRSGIGDVLSGRSAPNRDIDIAVPLSLLYPYILQAKDICDRHSVPHVCFGHAMDGNMHVMLLTEGLDDDVGKKRLKAAIDEIYTYALTNGGVISGEHGIGLIQKEFMPLQFSEPALGLMKRIKQVIDPNNILNPGKIFN